MEEIMEHLLLILILAILLLAVMIIIHMVKDTMRFHSADLTVSAKKGFKFIPETTTVDVYNPENEDKL